MTEQNEPSMEDILASIRNILAEDEGQNPKEENIKDDTVVQNTAKEPVAVARNNADSVSVDSDFEPKTFQNQPSVELSADQSATTAEKKQDDIVDLTAEMMVPQPQPDIQEISADDEEEDEDDFTPEPVRPQEPMKEETLTDLIKETAGRRLQEDDSLLAEPTLAATTESLSHLRDIASEKRLSLGKGDMTIEMIVRETLKPYLKEWLDINLPDIVERVVKKEIAHVMDRLDLK